MMNSNAKPADNSLGYAIGIAGAMIIGVIIFVIAIIIGAIALIVMSIKSWSKYGCPYGWILTSVHTSQIE